MAINLKAGSTIPISPKTKGSNFLKHFCAKIVSQFQFIS